jgi:hypothetical protein
MSVQSFANDAASVAKFADVHSRFAPDRNVNVELARSLSPTDRLAVWVTDRVGSMGFFFVVGAWTILWLGWNTFVPRNSASILARRSRCGSSSATCFSST